MHECFNFFVEGIGEGYYEENAQKLSEAGFIELQSPDGQHQLWWLKSHNARGPIAELSIDETKYWLFSLGIGSIMISRERWGLGR